MNFLIICAIFASCFLIGVKNGASGVFALFLCGCSFVFGVAVFREIVHDNAKNGELIEIEGKYYAVKYVKDKVE